MSNKYLTRIDGRTLTDALFVLLVFSLSLIPLVPWKGWDGYAPGTFVYKDENYYVRYNDETIGSDKPHIFLLEGWPIRSKIDIVELSDSQTYIDGLNLYESMESQGQLTEEGLVVYYNINNSDLRIKKTIAISKQKVMVEYESNKPVEFLFTFWRWYFYTVEGQDFRGIPLPINIDTKDTVNFEFKVGSITYKGVLEFSTKPNNIEVWKDREGINKILVNYVGSSISISISLKELNRFSLNFADKDLIYPIIGATSGIVYMRVGKYAIRIKKRINRAMR